MNWGSTQLRKVSIYFQRIKAPPGTTQPHSLIQVTPLNTPGVSWLHSHLSSNMLQPRNAAQSKINTGCMLQRWPTLVTAGLCVKTLTCPVELQEEGLWEDTRRCNSSLKVLREAGTRLQMQSGPRVTQGQQYKQLWLAYFLLPGTWVSHNCQQHNTPILCDNLKQLKWDFVVQEPQNSQLNVIF